jgi:hypothetical protein
MWPMSIHSGCRTDLSDLLTDETTCANVLLTKKDHLWAQLNYYGGKLDK